ncbi:HD domain-containing protein [Candidatus Gracilibacteria bacterium]|nr:HD domain-containing protein [Candidatus Gracilibacteria bacterium]
MISIKKIRQKRKINTIELRKNVLEIIGHIINDEDFLKLKLCRQHVFFNRYEHLLNVAVFVYKIAKFFKADVQSCTLAGVLHDYHFTNYKTYEHGLVAASNSEKFGIDKKTKSIIESHMYPFGRKKIKRAKGKDFWIIKFADSCCAIFEFLYSILFFSFNYKNKIKMKNNILLLELNQQNQQTINYVLSNK